MKPEYDFRPGERGKFFKPNAELRLPIYLEAQVQTYLSECAASKGMPLGELVNDFQLEPALLAHMNSLAGRANEGSLTEEQRTVYESLLNVADVISVIKLKAARRLNADV